MNPIKAILSGFVMVLMFAATQPAPAGIDVNVNVGGPPKARIDVQQGQNFTLSLPAHGRPDFAWRLVDSSHKVQLIQPGHCTPHEFKRGMCQDERWTFYAIDDGNATLRFQYSNIHDSTQVLEEAAFRVKIHD